MEIRDYNFHEEKLNLRIKSILDHELLMVYGIITIAIEIFRCFRWPPFEYMVYNSDSLYVINLYDAFKNNSLETLQFSHLPSVFPDGLVISALMALGAPFDGAYRLYSTFALCVLMGAIVAIIAELGEEDFSARCYAALCIVILLAMAPACSFFIVQTLIAGVHGGSLILSIATTWLSWKYLQSRGKSWRILLCVAILTGVGTFSDVILACFFVLPNLAASAILVMVRRRVTFDLALLNIALLATALAGHAAFALLPSTPFPPNDPTALARNVRLFLSTIGSARSVIGLVPASILVAVGTFALFRHAPRLKEISEAGCYFLATGLAATLAGGALVIAAYQDEYSYRYGMAAFWWPIILGVALTPLRRRIASRALKPAFVVLLACLAVTATSKEREPFWADTLVRCLDEMGRTVPLANGLADYWIAHPITEFSGHRYVVSQIDTEGNPYIWLNNRRDYFDDKRPLSLRKYNFTITDGRGDRELDRRYGLPDLRKACGGYSISYYADPSAIHKKVETWFLTH